ncbi:O-antigen ligase family protein [bacterium]|nr:O-antigen ligase family protein [bacterium]MBU1957386.1 O-antigen ligase family protein [bacterium]
MYKAITSKHYALFILFIVTALLLPLIHTTLFRHPFDAPKFALYDIVTSLITIYYFYYKKEFNFSLLSLLYSVLILFILLSFFQSSNIGYSFEFMFRFFNTVILIAFIYDFLYYKKVTLQQLENLILLSAFLFSIYYLYGTQVINIFRSNSSFSPIGHINYTAHVLNIWIPLLLLNFFIQKNKLLKYTSLILMIFLVDILIISGSRGSILGLILSEIIIVLFVFIKHKKIQLYPSISFALIGLFFMHQSFAPTHIQQITKKLERYSTVTHPIETTNKKTPKNSLNHLSSNRVNIYNNTIDMIIDNPWGVGAGNYEYIHPLYAKVGTPYATPYVNEKQVFTNPHNIILKFTSELGWIGGLLFIFILIILTRMVIITLLKGEQLDYLIAIAFGATLFHSMLSAVFLTPTNLFFSTLLFAILLYRYHSLTSSKIFFKLKKMCCKSFLIFIPLFFILFYMSKYYSTQFTTQRNFNYLQKALKFNPYNESALLKRAQFEAYANHNYPLAIHYLDNFLELYPYNINAHIKKATFQYRIKQYDQALKTIDKLLIFDKTNKKILDLKKRILTLKKK